MTLFYIDTVVYLNIQAQHFIQNNHGEIILPICFIGENINL